MPSLLSTVEAAAELWIKIKAHAAKRAETYEFLGWVILLLLVTLCSYFVQSSVAPVGVLSLQNEAVLRVLLGAPRLHHWHHAIEGGGRVNFANLSPLLDVLFGTWHDPGRMPDRIGLTEPFARSYLGALVEPLLPQRTRRG